MAFQPRFAVPDVQVSLFADIHHSHQATNSTYRNSYAQHAIKPDFDAVYDMYSQWKAAVDDISDVKGLYPTFVLNMAPKSAATVAKTNGIGNTWGLDDSESYICIYFSEIQFWCLLTTFRTDH